VLTCCSEAQEQKDVDGILQCQKAIGFHGGGEKFKRDDDKMNKKWKKMRTRKREILRLLLREILKLNHLILLFHHF